MDKVSTCFQLDHISLLNSDAFVLPCNPNILCESTLVLIGNVLRPLQSAISRNCRPNLPTFNVTICSKSQQYSAWLQPRYCVPFDELPTGYWQSSSAYFDSMYMSYWLNEIFIHLFFQSASKSNTKTLVSCAASTRSFLLVRF